jgi:hypothetical protein
MVTFYTYTSPACAHMLPIGSLCDTTVTPGNRNEQAMNRHACRMEPLRHWTWQCLPLAMPNGWTQE